MTTPSRTTRLRLPRSRHSSCRCRACVSGAWRPSHRELCREDEPSGTAPPCCQDGRVRRAVGPLLAVTVALVLADSAVVTLALPDILRHLDATVTQVAWVLISFNLVLGLVAVPTARGLRAGAAADLQRGRHRGVRRRLGVVRGGAVDRGADRRPVRAGARRRAGAGRVPRAPGRGVRRAPRDRHLDHGRRDRHGHRPGRRWAAHRRRSRGRRSSSCRCRSRCWRCRPRSRCARAAGSPPPVRHRPAVRPNLTLALLSAALTGGAVPAGPAPGRRLAALPGDRRADRVRRTGRGARRPPAGPAPAAAAEVEIAVGLLPDRRRAGRPGDPAVGRPRLDDRARRR